MPELPEVEVVKRGIEPFLTGARLRHVSVNHERTARRFPGGARALASALENLTVDKMERRGKYLWATIANDARAILFHLGMSGQILVDKGDLPSRVHTRLTAQIGADTFLSFVDQRTFGYVTIDTLVPGRVSSCGASTRMVPSLVQHIAPDVLEDAFDLHNAARDIRKRHVPIKTALLNQEIVSGIGNIYADEALWQAQVHAQRLASGLSYAKIEEILQAAQQVMRRALQVGGTSFDTLYVNAAGEPGYFARSLAAYGKVGKPCPRCGTTMERCVVGGRSHTYCPNCQKVPYRNR